MEAKERKAMSKGSKEKEEIVECAKGKAYTDGYHYGTLDALNIIINGLDSGEIRSLKGLSRTLKMSSEMAVLIKDVRDENGTKK